ncbi:helix-turn-helix domain-containing protein [Polaromonas sp. AET17H-212]|uniref:helix-turn-helix domain-containing protein n=1 Tax=Polaromonas sp. AET17H-212 TaxID=1977061 RepID=UPI0015966D07|nr:helix-turn-helix domain-containing protein [Polaromonas sp. AET17H-212]
MYEFAEIGSAIRTRRSDMGLTQARVAELCGLLPTTVEQLENGSIEKLDWAVAIRITAQLGLNVHISNPRPTRRQMERVKSALDAAAITASVSYKNPVRAEDLRAAFLTANNPPDYTYHVLTLLDEAPISQIAGVVEQLHHENDVSRNEIWKNMRKMANAAHLLRDIWQ